MDEVMYFTKIKESDADDIIRFAVAVLKTDAIPEEYDRLPEWVRKTAEELVALGLRLETAT